MAEDWLPHEPPTIEPPKHSAVRTLIIWVVLIGFFIALYWAMSPSESGGHHATAGYSGWWLVAAAVGGALVPIVFMVYLFGGQARLNALQTPALEALAERRYSRAAELFGELARRYRAKPNHSAVALYNRGYALLRSGDSAAAAGVLLGVERMPKLGPGGIRQVAVMQLARAFALGGDVEKAVLWLDVARKRPGGMADPVHGNALIAALEGLLMCRQGRVEEATRHYQDCWSRLEACLPVHQMEEVWLLRAFAIASTSAPRDNAAAEPWLRMLRSTPPGALDWLTVHWPELATFTITHGLAVAVAAPHERSA
ncbi:MAG: hypothetical protein H0T42_27775 [Deltaproteobacteria bacterium]|nr:hypothetical protein [Deltaproteobacteria bacterium]